jgi:Domain of unknown function (DUF4124)
MKISFIVIFFSSILFSLSASASEIYQCKSSEGKSTYSDKPCASGDSQQKLDFKSLSWLKALDADKPSGTKIIEITKDNDDTIIKYVCSTEAELSKFMRSAQEFSGMNINLLKYKASNNGGHGEGLIQITSKIDTLFKSKNQ